MGAFRVNSQDFQGGVLENQNPLAAHRDNDKMVLLQFGQFFSCQASRTDSAGAREGFEVANHGVQNAS